MIADDDPVFVLTKGSTAPHIMDNDIIYAFSGTSEWTCIETMIHFNPVCNFAVGIDVETLEGSGVRRLIFEENDGRVKISVRSDCCTASKAPCISDVSYYTSEIED